MPILRSAILVLLVSLVSAVPARAEGFISPWIGYNFGGDSANCLGLNNCEEHRNNYGVSAGAMGGVFGAEFDFGYAPDFFGKLSTGSNAVLTVMGNMMLIIPALNSSLADVSQNTLGYDIGGGINIFIVHSFGLRGDVRHMHTLQDVTLGVFQSQPLDFWRASAGVTFRF
jgi:hypothetical protein